MAVLRVRRSFNEAGRHYPAGCEVDSCDPVVVGREENFVVVIPDPEPAPEPEPDPDPEPEFVGDLVEEAETDDCPN